MGFFSEIDGELKPSDDYMSNHTLAGYEDGDFEHDDYEVTDDTVAMSLMRVCKICGKAFTLKKAIDYFDGYFEGEFFYMEEFVGQLCGECAVDDIEGAYE